MLGMVRGWFCAGKDTGQKATKSLSLTTGSHEVSLEMEWLSLYLYLYKVDAYWLILRCVKYPDDPIIFLKHSGMQCESWDSDILGQDLGSESPGTGQSSYLQIRGQNILLCWILSYHSIRNDQQHMVKPNTITLT